jgi:hypothetical protein
MPDLDVVERVLGEDVPRPMPRCERDRDPDTSESRRSTRSREKDFESLG